MDLTEALETQRAIRRLKPDPVDDEVILRCVRLAQKAPTGGNRQGVQFIIVRDLETKRALGRQYRRAWAVYGGAGKLLYRGDESFRKILAAVDFQLRHWDEVPAVVVVCMRGIPFPFPAVARTSRYGSVFPSIQNFLLAARNEGLGATLITLPLWSRVAAHGILGIPWYVEPIAAIPVGWPRGRYGPTTRKPVEDVVHVDRYGNRAFRKRSR